MKKNVCWPSHASVKFFIVSEFSVMQLRTIKLKDYIILGKYLNFTLFRRILRHFNVFNFI